MLTGDQGKDRQPRQSTQRQTSVAVFPACCPECSSGSTPDSANAPPPHIHWWCLCILNKWKLCWLLAQQGSLWIWDCGAHRMEASTKKFHQCVWGHQPRALFFPKEQYSIIISKLYKPKHSLALKAFLFLSSLGNLYLPVGYMIWEEERPPLWLRQPPTFVIWGIGNRMRKVRRGRSSGNLGVAMHMTGQSPPWMITGEKHSRCQSGPFPQA